jgi:hypothetical protein
MEEGSVFIPYGGNDLKDILYEQHERVVGNDNCVSFRNMKLQIPPDAYRMHYVKARVRVHRYPDGSMGVFHGPQRLAEYTADGTLIAIEENKKSVSGGASDELHGVPILGAPYLAPPMRSNTRWHIKKLHHYHRYNAKSNNLRATKTGQLMCC